MKKDYHFEQNDMPFKLEKVVADKDRIFEFVGKVVLMAIIVSLIAYFFYDHGYSQANSENKVVVSESQVSSPDYYNKVLLHQCYLELKELKK